MLALVHPLHSSEHRNIALPSLPISVPSSSTRSARSAHRKPPLQQAFASSAHQISSSSHFSSSKSHSVPPAVAYDPFTARPNAAPHHLQFPPSSSAPSTLPAPPPDNTPIHPPHPPPPDLPPSPVDIHSYAPTDLLKLLASLLTQIARTNDTLSSPDTAAHTLSNHSQQAPSDTVSRTPVWRSLTSASRTALANPASALTFHARNIPTITLEAYLLRILKYCPTTNEVFLALLVYFDRMSRLASEATGRTFVIDSYNVHRLVIAGVTVASKFFSDVFYTNSRYAKVCHLLPIFLSTTIKFSRHPTYTPSLSRWEVYLKQSSIS